MLNSKFRIISYYLSNIEKKMKLKSNIISLGLGC